MFTLKLTLTDTTLGALKAEVLSVLPHVKSSHRCEAVGRGLGFSTYAAAKTAASSTKSQRVIVDGKAFSSYLHEHGFDASPVSVFHAATKVALKAVAARNPSLTMWGIGIGRPQRNTDGKRESGDEFSKRFVAARAELVSDFAVVPFLLSLALLERVPMTKTIRQGTGSYWLKHIAENYVCTYPGGEELGPRYVPNGALIAAAVHAGFRFKSYVDEYGYEAIGVNFNMSKPALVDLDCEIRPNGARAEERRWKHEVREGKRRHQGSYRDYERI